MTRLKTQATAYAIALASGAIEVTDVIRWADKQIETIEQPDWELCQVSLSRGRLKDDVVRLLRNIRGGADRQQAMRAALRMIAPALGSDVERSSEIARFLFDQAAYKDNIDDGPLRDVCVWAWDALDLARDGIVQESYADVITRFRQAIEDAILRMGDAEAG
jgi:hypothetical protein